jgi:hypothetical protein
LILLRLERKILLRQVTEGDNDDGSQYLGHRGINMQLFYEEFDKNIVEEQTDHHQQKITEQLHPAMQGRSGKDDVSHQEKPRGKADAKGDEHRGGVGFQSNKTQVQVLLLKDKIIADKENKDIQQRIRASASRITKGLQRHDLAERRIEKINKPYDPFLCHRLKTDF